MIAPGQPIGQAFAERWLVHRCTVQSPTSGGGWTAARTNVRCRKKVAAPAMTPQPGGFVTKQQARFFFRRADAESMGITRGWRIIDHLGLRWRVEQPADEPEAPLFAVDVVEAN